MGGLGYWGIFLFELKYVMVLIDEFIYLFFNFFIFHASPVLVFRRSRVPAFRVLVQADIVNKKKYSIEL